MSEEKTAELEKLEVDTIQKMSDAQREIEQIIKKYNFTCWEIVATLETLKLDIVSRAQFAAGVTNVKN